MAKTDLVEPRKSLVIRNYSAILQYAITGFYVQYLKILFYSFVDFFFIFMPDMAHHLKVKEFFLLLVFYVALASRIERVQFMSLIKTAFVI